MDQEKTMNHIGICKVEYELYNTIKYYDVWEDNNYANAGVTQYKFYKDGRWRNLISNFKKVETEEEMREYCKWKLKNG